MKKYKNHIIAGAVILALLVFVYWWGGDSPYLRGFKPESKEITVTKTTEIQETPKPVFLPAPPSEKLQAPGPSEIPAETKAPENTPEPVLKASTPDAAPTPVTEPEKKAADMSPASIPESREVVLPPDTNTSYSLENGMEIDEKTGKDEFKTDPVPLGMPVPIEPQDVTISDKELICTLSVRCDTILNNLSWLEPEKAEIIPTDGIIFSEREVTFYEGESVFNVLLREMKRNKIHMEFVNVPIYNSAYIEGINNIYEFDCGELSGWMYKVNDWFPNYGCSRYQLKNGDRIEFLYTCNLGKDIGGYNNLKSGE